MNYDGETPNGVEYIKALYSKNTRYHILVDRLDKMTPQYEDILAGESVKRYEIGTGGSRSLTYNSIDPDAFMKKYESEMSTKLTMEESRKSRKAVGVVLRDY